MFTFVLCNQRAVSHVSSHELTYREIKGQQCFVGGTRDTEPETPLPSGPPFRLWAAAESGFSPRATETDQVGSTHLKGREGTQDPFMRQNRDKGLGGPNLPLDTFPTLPPADTGLGS